MEQNVEVKKYIVQFGVVYTIGLIALYVIFMIINLDSNSGSGASIALLFASAIYSVGKFIQDNKRVPNKNEKSKLVWITLLTAIIVSAALVVIVGVIFGGVVGLSEMFHALSTLPLSIMVGIIFFVTLLHFVILSYGYGGFASKQFDALKKKGKI